jgi:hypothetical protein
LYRPVTESGAPRVVGKGDPDAVAPYTPSELEKLARAVRYAQPNVTVRA